MIHLEPANYAPAIAELLRMLPLAPLGPGRPDPAVQAKLQALGESSFAPDRVADRLMAAACRAGLWLAFDFLDESHQISQDLDRAEGSYWHALMHRREPDASNAKYWFRRVGNHPVIRQLVEQAPGLGYNYIDPFAFVDFVERVRGTGTADEELARMVQRLEWELLFGHCCRAVF